jgi:hypothetical protein
VQRHHGQHRRGEQTEAPALGPQARDEEPREPDGQDAGQGTRQAQRLQRSGAEAEEVARDELMQVAVRIRDLVFVEVLGEPTDPRDVLPSPSGSDEIPPAR